MKEKAGVVPFSLMFYEKSILMQMILAKGTALLCSIAG